MSETFTLIKLNQKEETDIPPVIASNWPTNNLKAELLHLIAAN